MNDDRPAGSQPPQNQPPPQQGYQQQQQPQQQPPPQQRQGPNMPNMGNMADMGKGNPYLMNPDVRLNSIERMTVMLLRLVAWIALLLLVISICSSMISFLSSGGITFSSFLRGIESWLVTFVTGALAAVTLLGLASIVESLVMIRNNRS